MYMVRTVQRVQDKVASVEKELTHTIEDVRKDVRRNFRLLVGMAVLQLVPTLHALGIPTTEILTLAEKFFLGFIGL